MYQGAAALNGYEQWQRTISHNLAASQVPGYKQEIFAFQKKQMGKIPTETMDNFARMLGGSSPQAIQKTDFSMGQTVQTQVPTHVALQNDGFFSLQTPDGQTIYTRDGEFTWNNESVLVNKNGYTVQAEGGGEIVRDLNDGDITINRLGEVWQNGSQVGTIGVVNFENPDGQLMHVAGGFMVPPGVDAAAQPVDPDTVSMLQGFREMGNTSPVMEMVDMITVSRAYDNNTKVIQSYDDRYGRAIQNLTVG